MTKILRLLLILLPLELFANDFIIPLYPQCSLPYRKDSFGLGVMAYFKNIQMSTNSILFDSGCFALGKQWGKVVVEQSTDTASCPRDFEEGYRLGLNFELPSAGTGCFTAGYDAGVAKLHYLTRTQDSKLVSKSCLKSYKNGLKEGCSMMAPTLSTDRFLSECYVTGWNDGNQFQNVREICN